MERESNKGLKSTFKITGLKMRTLRLILFLLLIKAIKNRICNRKKTATWKV